MRNLSVDEKAMNNSKVTVQIVSVDRQRSPTSQRKVYLAVRVLATGNLFYVRRAHDILLYIRVRHPCVPKTISFAAGVWDDN